MIFLTLLFLLLPSQLAFHFWPSWSLVNGIRVDYLSPTLYLTDILIIILWLSNSPLSHPSLYQREGKGVSCFRVGVAIFVTLNIFFSIYPLLTIYKWFRVLEYFWLFKYLILKIDWKLKIVNWPLSLGLMWTSFLTLSQFILQRSVGGAWYWLGERPLSVSTPLIAKVSFFSHLLMRPYATFPHPNALAGFLLVSGLILYSVNRRITPAVLVVFLTIPLTFSRTAIVLEVLILLIWIRPLILKIVLIISSLYFLISMFGSIASLPDRLSLIHNSLILIQKYPILGVGLGSFIPSTMNYELITNNYLYQPVHNIYLLLASELGLPALFVVGYWVIKKSLKIKNLKLKIALAVVLATGALDHYWLTLHQNILLLVILIAYAYSYRRGSQR